MEPLLSNHRLWNTRVTMLFEHWEQIARAGKDQIALRDLVTGTQWSFAQLAAAAENGARDNQPIVFPRSGSENFIFAVLRAWRFGQIVCPLESGQAEPKIAGVL